MYETDGHVVARPALTPALRCSRPSSPPSAAPFRRPYLMVSGDGPIITRCGGNRTATDLPTPRHVTASTSERYHHLPHRDSDLTPVSDSRYRPAHNYLRTGG